MLTTPTVEIKEGYHNMDLNVVHRFLSNHSHWARGIPFDTVQVSLQNSFCVGIFENGHQVGFARMVTDFAVFGYIGDVFVLPEFRGKGYSKMMMEYIFSQDFVSRLRRIILTTKDAHTLYSRYGFQKPEFIERFMEINKKDDMYQTLS